MSGYHPVDTNNAVGGLPQEKLDHWHYQVNYYQIANHREQRSDKIMKKLHKEVNMSDQGKKVLEQLKKNWGQTISALSKYREVAVLEGKLAGKLVHGLGAPHVRETAITIHPVYGFPYLPASSIKGAVRNWALQAFFAGKIEQVEKALKDGPSEQATAASVFCHLVGTQEQRGRVQFYDAYPSTEPKLNPDVMTVHFKDYYTGSKPPTDDQSTNPIAFYAMAPTKFLFIFALSKKNLITENIELSSGQMVKIVATWLEKMLIEQGIGSKTRLGYGSFDMLDDVTQQWLEEYKQPVADFNPVISTAIMKKAIKSDSGPGEPAAVSTSQQERSPKEELLDQISRLTVNEADQATSKGELFKMVVEMAKEGEKEPANALKAYWEETDNWKDNPKKEKKDKQAKKTIELKQLLEN
jgi:CRISPR-associated protein Cmr6